MKAIVSLSGGRDSSTCLGLAVEKFGAENVYAIGFEYGSKHPQELEQAKKIAAYYGVPYQIVTINPEIFAGSTCTLLAGNAEVQRDMSYDEIMKANGEGKVDTYVPFRNGLFSAFTAAKAESLVQQFNDDVTILLGQHADDAAGAAYPDCSPEFVDAMAKVVEISSVDRVKYWAPFVNMHKHELIKVGMELKKPVPYHLCMSCYEPVIDENGHWHECGRCATCLDVKKNYEKAGYTGPMMNSEE